TAFRLAILLECEPWVEDLAAGGVVAKRRADQFGLVLTVAGGATILHFPVLRMKELSAGRILALTIRDGTARPLLPELGSMERRACHCIERGRLEDGGTPFTRALGDAFLASNVIGPAGAIGHGVMIPLIPICPHDSATFVTAEAITTGDGLIV